MTRVAFAGLPPLREGIVRDALDRAGNFQVVEPWTSLRALRRENGGEGEIDILFIELADAWLPSPIRAMLAAAAQLRIVALSVDATRATVFEFREHQTVMMSCAADDLCSAIAAAGAPARAHEV